MGFTHHPGPLPFVTLRTQKWANRTWVGEVIEVHGEHGCDMPATPAVVVSIEPHDGPCPAHLFDVYRSAKLFRIALSVPD